MRIRRALALSLLAVPALVVVAQPFRVASAQAVDSRTFYYPKPLARTPWQPPMKPITRLA